MRVTAFLNLKGGVGKTTSAVNVAAILGMIHQKKVLVVDADSQCNTTEFFGVKARKTFANLLRVPVISEDAEALLHEYAVETKVPGVWLLPADEELMDLDLSRVRQKDVFIYSLKMLLLAWEKHFDYCIIDCPPAFNAACAAALIGANDVVIPIKLDAFSLRGMANLTRQVSNMRRINQQLCIAGVLPTMWYEGKQTREAVRLIEKAGIRVFRQIRLSRKVDAMTWEQNPIIVCSPKSAAAVDYKRFVAEYLGLVWKKEV